MGWIGSSEAMMNALRVVGADCDGEGRFLITGEPPVSFMGAGEEYVISDKVMYLKNGKRCGLAALLNSTSARLPVVVIGSDGVD